MEGWIEFGRGPLFRLAFSLMVLGLLRVFVLTVAGIGEAYRRNSDRIMPWKEIRRQTLGWIFPFGRLCRQRPLYSLTSFVFHLGLLVTPLWLAAHVTLWRTSVGFAWWPLPQQVADYLTLITIAAGLGLFFGRALQRGARALSRFQDYLWPLLLVLPFASGYVCSHAAIGPRAYQGFMLLHVYSADLIMVMIPFTKIAHCVLAPLSQLVTTAAWKFVPGAGDRVAATLGYGELPIWAANARSAVGGAAQAEARKEICAK